MKNVKNFLILTLVVAVMLGTTAYAETVPIPYEQSGSAAFSVACPISNLKVGDTAYITIKAENLTNPYGYEFYLNFDESFLTYSKADCGIEGDYISAEDTSEKNNVKLAFSKTSDSAAIGNTLATVEFTVKKSGSSTVTLTDAVIVNDGMDYNIYSDMSASATVTAAAKTTSSGGGGGGGGGSYGGGFTVQGGNTVTSLSPTIQPIDPSIPTDTPVIFTDLNDAEWSESAILGLYELDIIGGYEDKSFRPNNSITRAEFCKILVLSLGVELEQDYSQAEFTDVVEDEWYAPYVLTAAKGGIVSGYENGTFMPDSDITREEAAAMVCRSAEYLGVDLNSVRLNINFEDEQDIAEYAVGYVDNLYMAGIINGDENGCFRPFDSISRAETAKMLWDYYNILNPPPTEEPEATESSETVVGERMALDDEDTAEEDLEPTEEPLPEESGTPQPTEPIETAEPTEEPEPTETPLEPTEEPDFTFEPDIVYDCDSLEELYSYTNVYAYLIPDDGSREAFYDDFTTFQRPTAGEAEIVYEAPYANGAEIVSYFYGGEALVDFSFQTSLDGEEWTEAEFTCEYTEAEGKWTRAVYTLSDIEETKLVKIIYPETVNWWTPLVSQVSFTIGSSVPKGINIKGDRELIIPRYDYTDYVYSGEIVDNIGEIIKSEILYSIAESDFEGVSVDQSGTVRIDSSFPRGGKFVLKAECPEFGFSSEIEVTLKPALIGDMNGDGSIDSADLEAVLQCYNKSSGDAEWKQYRDADINGDEIVNIIDIAYVAKISSFK